ncbi:MAG: ABC transporter permease [Chloroflexi bacterium RBG_13_54_9]|nr:MAG: ABC transporter permease [Chloroflexi bacterium RBG_13_54_9]
MNLRVVGALVIKDLSLFFRNRAFTLLTIFGLIVYLIIYFVIPGSVDESLDIGLYAPVVPPAFEQIQGEGLKMEVVESEETLRKGVIEGRYVAGVALPADIMERLMSGQKPQVKLYFTSDAPGEIKDAVGVLITEFAYLQTGQSLAIEVSEEILGQDMIGMQIPPRDRLRPLLAVFILLVETMGLATLIGEEVERRTIQALLVTPMTVRDLFAAKGIMGVSLAFGQATLFMAVVGGMSGQPLIMLATLLLGAVLVTGIGFLIGSLARDMLSVMPWVLVVFIPLVIPSFNVMFPGTFTGWVKVIPSYYLVDTVHRVSNFGAGWGDIWRNLLMLALFSIVIVWIGITALRRKFQ